MSELGRLRKDEMERWIPLFEIFLHSPSPEGEASLWLQQQQSRPHLYSPNAFLGLLLKPMPPPIDNPDPGSIRYMLIQTLPITMQSRIISFLTAECRRFPTRDLLSLASNLLEREMELDFWVKKAARQLFDVLSSNIDACSNVLSSSSNHPKQLRDKQDEDFESLPDWLNPRSAAASDPVLSWLPLSAEELHASALVGSSSLDDRAVESSTNEIGGRQDAESGSGSGSGSDHMDRENLMKPQATQEALQPEILPQIEALKLNLKTFSSVSQTISSAEEIHHLCFKRCPSNPVTILGLLQPWEADDETTAALLPHLFNEGDDDSTWASCVLSSFVLPKMLVLQKTASRVLVTATTDYCKLHPKAAVDGLLLPALLVREGINTPLCDVLTRVIRECLHPAHASAFCQKLLCEKEVKGFMCLPCHRGLISSELVWTDALFTLFQNILNCNIYLTQDSIDGIVSELDAMADRFSKSVRFGNFLLCLVSKCAPSLKVHKLSLMKVVQRTNTFMTKSISSKIAAW